MKLSIVSKNKEEKGSVELSQQFTELIRLDIIKRAVEAEQSAERQPYGAFAGAGMRHAAYLSKRRSSYKSTYGIGQSRTPRKVVSRSGTRFNYVGAVAPQTVGGRRAHPPKAEKNWEKKINKKEHLLALRSAISATLSKELVEKRGHKLPQNYPFVVDNSLTTLKKTKEVIDFLTSLGISDDLKRAEVKKIRAGKGKMRGRKYKKRTSALIVTEKDCPLSKSAKNIPGIQVVTVSDLNVQMLAPGAVAGRMTLWTNKAIEKIQKENLFM